MIEYNGYETVLEVNLMYLYGYSIAMNLSMAIATKLSIEPVIFSNVKQCETRQ